MKKRKLGVILGAAIGAACLAGATFAAWAVTDNANPLGIQITPKDNGHTDFSTMTLEWGDITTFTDLSNFELGEANAKPSKVQVKSKVITTEEGISGGNLTMTLSDRTKRDSESVAKLIDHLVVEAYGTRTGSGTTQDPFVYTNPFVSLVLDGTVNGHSVNQNISTATDGIAKDIFFKIYIDNSEGNEITPEEFLEMKSDIVYLEIDWNKPTTVTDLVTSTTIYYKAGTSKTDVSVWAWSSTSVKTNAESWPGVRMDAMSVEGGYYSYALSSEFDRLIFSWGGHGDSEKTETLEVTVAGLASAPCYDGEKWVAAPEFTELTYNCIGKFNNWTAAQGAMTKQSDGTWTIVVQTAGNEELKVLASDGMTYYGANGKGTSESTTVFTLNDQGTYTITFTPNPEQGSSYITSAKQ